MTNGRVATVWFVVIAVLVLVAMLVFKIRVAVLGGKYLLVLLAIVALVATVVPRKRP